MMKYSSKRKPLNTALRSVTMLVIMTLITCVQCVNTSDVTFSDTDVAAKTPIDHNTIESVKTTSYNVERYTGDVYNPVLQNFSALEHAMQIERKRQLASKHDAMSGADPRGTLTKRSSTSLRSGTRKQCNSSLCPWIERTNITKSRTPSSITYAVCRKRNCDFSFANLTKFVDHILKVDTTCKEVFIDIRVLENGKEKWLTDWPIACICTRTRHRSTVEDERPSRRTFPPDVPYPDTPHENPSLTFVTGERSNLLSDGRRLIRQYQRQKRRRQRTESFPELMSRRPRERNNSNP